MRLQREAKMAKKDIETQIKKTGKINDGFICLPDPEDAYVWYYIVFGLDYKGWTGGFYMGKIICPDEYPAKAPKVIVLTENGRFHTWSNGICLSISDYHPESWNPVWKVSQIVIGLTSFWQTTDDTYGGVYARELGEFCKNGEKPNDCIIRLAKESREKVLNHDKFKIFEQYASAIGIDKVPKIEISAEEQERLDKAAAKLVEEKRIAEELRLKEEQERLIRLQKEEEERKIQEQKEKLAQAEKIKNDYFKLISQMGLKKVKVNKKKAKAA
jgi:ubiquitin-protein ligase